MLLKLATWYINHVLVNTPSDIGRIDDNGSVIWPANG